MVQYTIVSKRMDFMDWLKVSPNIYRYSLLDKNVLPYSVNIYLIVGNSEALFIDCGYESPHFKQAIMDALLYFQLQPRNCKLLITHIHIDHCGNADFCYEQGMEIILNPIERTASGKSTRISKDTALLCGVDESNFYEYEHQTLQENRPIPGSRLPYKMLDKNIPYTPINIGDKLTISDYNFDVYAFAGHSPAHLCLHDIDKGVVFSGDLIVLGTVPVVLSTMADQQMLTKYLKTLDFLNKIKSKVFFPGHCETLRKEFSEPELAINTIKNDYNMLLNRLNEWIIEDSSAKTVVQMAARLYKCSESTYLDSKHDAKTVMLMKILSCLEHLHETGRIQRFLEHNTAYYRVFL